VSSQSSLPSSKEDGEVPGTSQESCSECTVRTQTTETSDAAPCRVFNEEFANQFLRRDEMRSCAGNPPASPVKEKEIPASKINIGPHLLQVGRPPNSTPAYWRKPTCEGSDEGEHTSTTTTSDSVASKKSPDREQETSYMNRQSDENSIVIMGVPEDFSLDQLRNIMFRILPSFKGQVTNKRVGLGLRGPRPVKVTLANRAEVEKAISNAKIYPVVISNSFILRVGKYRSELDPFQPKPKPKRFRPRRQNFRRDNNSRSRRDRQRFSRSRSSSRSSSRSRSRSLSRFSKSNQ